MTLFSGYTDHPLTANGNETGYYLLRFLLPDKYLEKFETDVIFVIDVVIWSRRAGDICSS